MLDRDRLHQLAVRGLLIVGVVLLTAGVGPCESQDTGQSQPKAASTDKAGAEGQHKADHLSEIAPQSKDTENLARIAAALEAMRADQNSKDEQDRAKRDLGAQEEMARWALPMLLAAGLQALIGAAGIWYIRRTLVATRDIAKMQLRAYMCVDKFTFSSIAGSEKDTFEISFKNSGSTPALKLWGHLGVVLMQTDKATNYNFDRSMKDLANERSVDNVGTQGVYNKSIESVTLRMATPQMINSGEWIFFIFGTIVYDDIFGDQHRTTVRLQWGGADPNLRRHGLVMSPEGNEMT